MQRTGRVTWANGTRAALGLAALLASCTPRRDPGSQCAYASDCLAGLSCVTGFCRQQCREDRDCAQGRCLSAGTSNGNVCVLPNEPVRCGAGLACPSAPASDCVSGQCFQRCSSARDCPAGQQCSVLAGGVGLCSAALTVAQLPPAGDAGVDDATTTGDGATMDGSADASDAARPDAPFLFEAGVDAPPPSCGDAGADAGGGATVVQLAASFAGAFFALRGDGTVVSWGAGYPAFVVPVTDVARMAVSNDGYSGSAMRACFVQRAGNVLCASSNDPRALRPAAVGGAPSRVLDLMVTNERACAIDASDGSVVCWGTVTGFTTPAVVPAFGVHNVQLSGALATLCARNDVGEVRCVGSATYNELGSSGSIPFSTTTPMVAPVPFSAGRLVGRVASVGRYYLAQLTAVPSGASTALFFWGFPSPGAGTPPPVGPNPNMGTAAPTALTELLAATYDNYASDSPTFLRGLEGTRRVVYVRGSNPNGELGLPTTAATVSTWQHVTALPETDIEEVVVGGQATCARTACGGVYCWGSNRRLNLGDGTTVVQTSTPTRVGTFTGVLDVSVGSLHACAVTADHHVWCWGANASGQLGVPAASLSFTATPRELASEADAVAVTVVDTTTCVRRSTGSVQCYGTDTGSLTAGAPAFASGISGVEAYSGASAPTLCALRGGALQCWGYSSASTTTAPSLIPGVMGTARTPATVPSASMPFANVSAVDVGAQHACALFADGTGQCWGTNSSNVLGSGVTAVGTPVPAPVPTSGGALRQLALGANFSCFLRDDGVTRSAQCVGSGANGALGNGATSAVAVATNVLRAEAPTMPLQAVRQLDASGTTVCAVTDAGALYCWGSNATGQLGQPLAMTTASRATLVPGLTTNVQLVRVGPTASCAIVGADRQLQCWGDNQGGLLGIGGTLPFSRAAVPVVLP